MTEYIDRQQLIERIKETPTYWDDGGGACGVPTKYPSGMYYPDDIISCIEDTPLVDATEVKYGEWVYDSNTGEPRCSECGEDALEGVITPYCPHCGAKMDEEGENVRG